MATEEEEDIKPNDCNCFLYDSNDNYGRVTFSVLMGVVALLSTYMVVLPW